MGVGRNWVMEESVVINRGAGNIMRVKPKPIIGLGNTKHICTQ